MIVRQIGLQRMRLDAVCARGKVSKARIAWCQREVQTPAKHESFYDPDLLMCGVDVALYCPLEMLSCV